MILINDRSFPLRGLSLLSVAAGLALTGTACTNLFSTGGGGPTDDNGNVLLNENLGFDGSLSGKIVDTQSTRASLTNTSAAQSLPPDFDTSDTLVRFKDLAGNDLLGPNGRPIEPVRLNPDGSFDAQGLPVGVDFTICADIGTDGSCDIESCINIPSDSGGGHGEIDGVQADPLTTLVLAKLRRLLDEKGIDPRDLPVSPVAVATRIVDAYTHLFEEAGIDRSLSLDDLDADTVRRLAELFDELIPAGARVGMDLVDGNLDLVRARDTKGRALSIAKVFLRAGFPIADGPDDPDLSELGQLEGIETLSLDELFAEGDSFTDEFADHDESLDAFIEDTFIGPAEFDDDDFHEVVVYVNSLAEPDRNFAQSEDEGFEEGPPGPELPVLHDYLILEMARMKQENRRLTLGDLYDLLTSIDDGLGARLTYFIFDPNFIGPPLNVFETRNGEGQAINLERFFRRIFADGFDDLDPEGFERREVELRRLLNDLLSGTIPPTFGRLFNAIVRDRVGSAAEFAAAIRDARAHLPFSRSGPSEFFVVADGDPFRGDTGASAITVDVEMTVDGDVLSVHFNEGGSGRFWLGFTHGTEETGFVELLVRETGRFLHGHRGPVRLNMNNADIFEPIAGEPFIDFVSETANFFPGINVTVIRDSFVPEPIGPEPFFEDFDFFSEPHDPLFDEPGEGTDTGLFPGPDALDGDLIVDQPPISDDETLPDSDDTLRPDEEETTSVTDETTSPTTDLGIVSPAGEEFTPIGPHQQIFVLATSVGFDAEPVRVDYDRDTGIATYNPGGRHLLMFLPDSDQTGLFALFNEKTGRPASNEDPNQFFEGPIERPDRFEDFFNNFEDFDHFSELDDLGGFIDEFLVEIPLDELFFPPDGEFFPPDGEFFPEDGELHPEDGEFFPPDGEIHLEDGEFLPPDEGFLPPLDDNVVGPAELGDDVVFDEPFDTFDDPFDDPFDGFFEGPFEDDFFGEPVQGEFGEGFEILVFVGDIEGLPLRTERFTHVFGTNVQNLRYDPTGDPFFDDINGDGVEQADEPTAQFRPTLFDPNDWRSTDIRLYYRRADNNEAVRFDDVDFESPTPRAMDGVELVPRNYHPRLNAFRFSRPNTAINLLTAFLPPEFFDGTRSLKRDTRVDVLTAVALINLVMDQVFNVEADIDIDGLGPLPRQKMLIDAHLFVAPVGDPFVLLLKGFRNRSVAVSEPRP
ncbi:MAG: hypothetical protein V3W34_16485 [Phycisphaerae bacterium]